MNIQRPDLFRVFPNAGNPLTSALIGTFAVPCDQPAGLKALLKRLEPAPQKR